jgi:hypothetical protein
MKTVYIADPEVAAAYHVAQGEWATIDDDAEADWLVANKHAATLAFPAGLPAAGFVHPDAPLPFVPYYNPGGSTQPAKMTTEVAEIDSGVFTIGFGGEVDTVEATVSCQIRGTDLDQTLLADVRYAQPAGTSTDEAAAALAGALAGSPAVGVNSTGSIVGVQGVPPAVVGTVVCQLTIPRGAQVTTRRTLLPKKARA